MKAIQEHSIKMNLNFLKDVNKNVEKAMSVMALVSTFEIGRAHVRTPVTEKSRMPSSA